ncbi:MAG: hypothetical protein LKF44_08330 [Atopobiaceae bacterium]|jgi:hypothetical protein|nr:hypothetical protein [Atopobiaceae bacterium]
MSDVYYKVPGGSEWEPLHDMELAVVDISDSMAVIGRAVRGITETFTAALDERTIHTLAHDIRKHDMNRRRALRRSRRNNDARRGR